MQLAVAINWCNIFVFFTRVFPAFGKSLCSFGQWQHWLHRLGPLHPSGLLTLLLHIGYTSDPILCSEILGINKCVASFAPLLGIRKKQTIMFHCWFWSRPVKWSGLHHVCVSPEWLQIHSLKEYQRASDKHNHTLPIAMKCWSVVFPVLDFHQNIKKLESPCGNKSDDCTTLCQQCLWDRPCGAVGFIPSG